MKLERLTEDDQEVRLACSGEVSQIRFRADDNPVEELLGPDGFRKKAYLDFSQAEWIDSSGISWLIVTHKQFAAKGGIFVIHSLPKRISIVLKFCRIDTVLNVAGDENAARSLAGNGRG